jgi:uncharacterized protein
MDRETVIAKLKDHEAELRGLGVAALYLFGSVAEGKQRPDSDVDLFFDPVPEAELSLFDLVGIQLHLTDTLGVDRGFEPACAQECRSRSGPRFLTRPRAPRARCVLTDAILTRPRPSTGSG